MFERFTEKAIKAIMLAQEETRRLGHNFCGTEQFLLGLISEGTSIAAKSLKASGVNLKSARIEVENHIGRGSGFVPFEIPFTPRAKRVLEYAWDEARSLKVNYIAPEHLLLGLLNLHDCIAVKTLENLDIDTRKLKALILVNIDNDKSLKRSSSISNTTFVSTLDLVKSSVKTTPLSQIDISKMEKFETLEERVTSLESLIAKNSRAEQLDKAKENCIFIGHGRSSVWAKVNVFLHDENNLKTNYFERENHTSESIVPILEDFLSKSTFAILVMTAEDETAEEKIRARQNVVHEAGLFQGRLGFGKVVILKQKGLEEFSNIDGLQYIEFSDDHVEQTFYELGRKLKKENLI